MVAFKRWTDFNRGWITIRRLTTSVHGIEFEDWKWRILEAGRVRLVRNIECSQVSRIALRSIVLNSSHEFYLNKLNGNYSILEIYAALTMPPFIPSSALFPWTLCQIIFAIFLSIFTTKFQYSFRMVYCFNLEKFHFCYVEIIDSFSSFKFIKYFLIFNANWNTLYVHFI